MSKFEQEFLEKYNNRYEFSEEELRDIRWNFEEVVTEYEEPRRWTRTATTIFIVADRYFALEWEQGLTECQENEFWEQPYEVEKKEYSKTVIVTEWIKKEDN